MARIEQCENCGRAIGKLERACLYKQRVVCEQCNQILRHPVSTRKTDQTKSISGLGIAALVLGIIACLTCWIPYVGAVSLPLAIIGFIFGVIGTIVSLMTRRSYTGLPAAGAFVSLAAAVIFLVVTGATSTAITESARSITGTRPELQTITPEPVPVRVTEREAKLLEEKGAYISKVEIINLTVGKTVLGDWGVFGEIRNTGDRTLAEVEITVYYFDENRYPIYEDTFYPVHTSGWRSDSKPLKPNYAEKFGYEADSVPSAWSKEITAQVTNIEFAD